MNPEPVIVTEVSDDPATMDDGVTAVLDGAGFEAGAGFVGADVPPPQPAIMPRDDATNVRRTPEVQFINDFIFKTMINGIAKKREHHT